MKKGILIILGAILMSCNPGDNPQSREHCDNLKQYDGYVVVNDYYDDNTNSAHNRTEYQMDILEVKTNKVMYLYVTKLDFCKHNLGDTIK